MALPFASLSFLLGQQRIPAPGQLSGLPTTEFFSLLQLLGASAELLLYFLPVRIAFHLGGPLPFFEGLPLKRQLPRPVLKLLLRLFDLPPAGPHHLIQLRQPRLLRDELNCPLLP